MKPNAAQVPAKLNRSRVAIWASEPASAITKATADNSETATCGVSFLLWAVAVTGGTMPCRPMM
jgi:hypothetical protein